MDMKTTDIVEELYSLFNNNKRSLLQNAVLEQVFDRSVNIGGLNFFNRFIAYLQDNDCTILKTSDEWRLAGREVDKTAKKVYIFSEITEQVFYDAETGKQIPREEMPSSSDLEIAIKYDVIDTGNKLLGLQTVPLYDIRDTSLFSEELFNSYCKQSDKKISISKLLMLCSDVLSITVKKTSGASTYDIKNKELLIGSDGTDSKVYSIGHAILSTLGIDNIIEGYEQLEINNDLKKLFSSTCIVAFTNSLISYCLKSSKCSRRIKYDISMIDLKDKELDIYLQMVAAVYSLADDIIAYLNDDDINAVDRISLIKAAEILDRLESNYARKRLGY